MATADEIREYVIQTQIKPARAANRGAITIRAGDIHSAMRLQNAMPNVCSALGGRKLQNLANISLREREGPRNGANVYFTFQLGDAASSAPRPTLNQRSGSGKSFPPSRQMQSSTQPAWPDWKTALILVSCVKTKTSFEIEAEHLYTSPWFRSARSLVKKHGLEWRILSAEYGLLHPSQRIQPYEKTLKGARVFERRKWADGVLEELLPEAKRFERVVFLAGMNYREFLLPRLVEAGLQVDIPMEGLPLGGQLSWLERNQ